MAGPIEGNLVIEFAARAENGIYVGKHILARFAIHISQVIEVYYVWGWDGESSSESGKGSGKAYDYYQGKEEV